MSKCAGNKIQIFNFFTLKGSHLFLISNIFYTLEDYNLCDVIKTCQYCGVKETLVLDKETLLEALVKFPNAFKTSVREYLQTWMK